MLDIWQGSEYTSEVEPIEGQGTGFYMIETVALKGLK